MIYRKLFSLRLIRSPQSRHHQLHEIVSISFPNMRMYLYDPAQWTYPLLGMPKATPLVLSRHCHIQNHPMILFPRVGPTNSFHRVSSVPQGIKITHGSGSHPYSTSLLCCPVYYALYTRSNITSALKPLLRSFSPRISYPTPM